MVWYIWRARVYSYVRIKQQQEQSRHSCTLIERREEEVERNQVIGPNHEFYDRYIAAKADITNLRIEANNAAIEAAKQTNTVLPKPDKSKYNDGYGYVNVRTGIYDANYGIARCNRCCIYIALYSGSYKSESY